MSWAVWDCKCTACGHRSVNVAPYPESQPPFECSECGEMTVQTKGSGRAEIREREHQGSSEGGNGSVRQG